MFKQIADIAYLLKRYRQYDPATKSYLEILFLYPGVRALFFYRIAHFLYCWRVPFLPRLVSELGRWLTLIEIHPGAKIGRGLIIDHGQGTTIGETSVIGNDVTMQVGVILGAIQFEPEKRHPTIEDGVFLGSGCKILGNITIGAKSRIGAGAVVLVSCPPSSTMVGIPARVVRSHNHHRIGLAA